MDNSTNTKIPFVAVIGSGYWGKNLVRVYHQLGALKMVCDRDETILSQVRRQFPGVDVGLTINDALESPNIDAVVIATPAETHYALAREALLAERHVFVEKPLVLNEKEGEELIKLADEKGLVLMVGHLLQYHPAFICLKEIVSRGELGRINYIYSNRLNFGKIRTEENILWSFAPHDISMVLALAGENPESVLAAGGNYLHKKIADVTTTHLEFPSGLKAHIFVSWLHPFKEQILVVVGDQKMAVFNDTKPWSDKLLIYPHRIKWEDHTPIPEKEEPESVQVSQSEPLLNECDHFLSCIRTRGTPITDGHEGLQVLRILNASQRSLDNNGEKICLNSKRSEQNKESNSVDADWFIHPTSIVDDEVTIGKGTKIWHFSHILEKCKIGKDCNIGQNVVIGPEVTIGDRCKIQNNVSIYKGVVLEDGVFCGPSMVFTNVYNPRAEIRKMDQLRPTTVKRGTTIGANATIVCGTTIGRYAFVGAGAVVTRNILDHALVVGNPAHQVGWVCQCGERLSKGLECLLCNKRYIEENGTLIEK